MKYEMIQPVRYADVDSQLRLSTKSIFTLLQEAAIMHASLCGDSPTELRERGQAWVLLKMGVEFVGPASFGESLLIQTWSRGSKGVKAYRDFRVTSSGRPMCQATSVWAYIDAVKERVLRIPENLDENYKIESELATSLDLDAWKPESLTDIASSVLVTTRTHDFDTNGHMNNTVYGSLLDSVLCRHLGQSFDYDTLVIQYEQGVTPEAESVEVLIHETKPGSFIFRVQSDEVVAVRGECSLTSLCSQPSR